MEIMKKIEIGNTEESKYPEKVATMINKSKK